MHTPSATCVLHQSKLYGIVAKRGLLGKKSSVEHSPGILLQARGKLWGQLEESSLLSWAKNWAVWPSNSMICLAIAKHPTSTRKQHLHGDAQRRQRPAVGCFSAAGPGRLVKAEGTWKQENITKNNLTQSAREQLGGRFILQNRAIQMAEKKLYMYNDVNVLEWPSQSSHLSAT